MPLFLAFSASIFWGCSDFLGGIATKKVNPFLVVLWVFTVGLIVVISALFLAPAPFSLTATLWGVLGGVALSLALASYYQALATQQMGVIAPIAAVIAAIVPVAFGVLAGERPQPLATIGVVIGLCGIGLSSIPDKRLLKTLTGQIWAQYKLKFQLLILYGVSFGIFEIAFKEASKQASNVGAWPVLSEHLVAIFIFLLIVILSKQPLRPVGNSVKILVGTGITGGIGDIAFLLATQKQLLVLVAMLSSFGQLVIVLLARVILYEKLNLTQKFGVVFAAVCVTMIAGGSS